MKRQIGCLLVCLAGASAEKLEHVNTWKTTSLTGLEPRELSDKELIDSVLAGNIPPEEMDASRMETAALPPAPLKAAARSLAETNADDTDLEFAALKNSEYYAAAASPATELSVPQAAFPAASKVTEALILEAAAAAPAASPAPEPEAESPAASPSAGSPAASPSAAPIAAPATAPAAATTPAPAAAPTPGILGGIAAMCNNVWTWFFGAPAPVHRPPTQEDIDKLQDDGTFLPPADEGGDSEDSKGKGGKGNKKKE